MTELELTNRLSSSQWTIHKYSKIFGYWWSIRESCGTRLVHADDVPWQDEELYRQTYGHTQTLRYSYHK